MVVNSAIQRQRGSYAHLDRAFVQNGQRAGQTEADRANIGVRRVAEPRRAATENLGLGQQLRMDFQADHGLILSEQGGRDGGFGDEFRHWLGRKYSREGLRPDYGGSDRIAGADWQQALPQWHPSGSSARLTVARRRRLHTVPEHEVLRCVWGRSAL